MGYRELTANGDRLASLSSSYRVFALICLSSLAVGLSIVWLPPYVTTAVILLSVLLLGATLASRLSIPFLIFSAFYFLTMAGSRDFAHVGVEFGSVPLFVSELTLLVVTLTLIPQLSYRNHALQKVFPPALLAYLGLGLIALLRGLPQYGLEAVRDSALCYYAICYPITILLTNRARYFRVFLYMMVASWAAAAVMVLYRYAMGIGGMLHLHHIIRYGSGSQAISAASSAGVAVAAWVNPRRLAGRRLLYIVGIAQALIGLFLIQHRSLFLAFIAVCFFVVAYCVDQRRRLVTFLGCLALMTMLSPFLLTLSTDRLPFLLRQTVERVKSIGNPHSDGSSEWRLFAWKQGLKEGMENPIFGVGFGRPLDLHLQWRRTDYDVDPHNSYVALFYRLGFSGVAAFLALWLPILVASYRAARKDPSRRFRIAFALSSHLGVALFALFNVALEGPYMGIPFWCSMGLLRQAIDTEGDWPAKEGE